MQLKIQRSQRASFTNVIIFCLDIRADYSAEEQDNIRKYRLGAQGIYNSRAAARHLDAAGRQLDRTQEGDAKNRAAGLVKGAFSLALSKMHLNVTIASLGKGHHIECKDLEELLEAEDTLRNACKNLTRYLEVANTFNGSEVVIEYVNGKEQVHITQNVPPLLEYQDGASKSQSSPAAASSPSGESTQAEWIPEASSGGQSAEPPFQRLVNWWLPLETRLTDYLNQSPLFANASLKLTPTETRVLCILAAGAILGLIIVL